MDIDLAKNLAKTFGGWFGPPAIIWRKKIVDGRIRIRVIENYPTIAARSPQHLTQLLLAAGHPARAAQLIGHWYPRTRAELEKWLGQTCHDWRKLLAMREPQPRQISVRKRAASRLRTDIKRLAHAVDEGHIVTSDELRGLL